ncbi:MAG: hypothetical protein ACLP7J_19400 [Streptosporangiaceae bacterium]
MFTEAEVTLDIGYGEARQVLARLADSEVLTRVCETAYGEGITVLAGGAGPAAEARLSGVRAQLIAGDSWGYLTLRWEAMGPDGRLFPAVDADLTLTRAGDHASVLTVFAAYRLPPAGPRPDGVLVGCAAAVTIRGFLARTASIMRHPAMRGAPASARARPAWPARWSGRLGSAGNHNAANAGNDHGGQPPPGTG